MSAQQIIFNDQELELPDNALIAVTSQINVLSDLKDHKSNLTNTVKVPATKHNLKVIGNSDQVQSESLIPYRKNRARIIKDGVDATKNGFAELRNIDKEINLVIYEGNVDFFASIEGKTLYDLDLSALDHDYNLTDILAFNTATSGLKYPLVNYGYFADNTTRIVDPKNLRPCIFAFEILNKIISEAGYTGEGSALTNANWLKTLIPFTNGSNPKLWYNRTIYQVVSGAWSATSPSLADPPAYINGQEYTLPSTVYYNYNSTIYLRYKVSNISGGGNYVRLRIEGTGVNPFVDFGTTEGIGEISFTDTNDGIGKLFLAIEAKNCDVEILGGRWFGTIAPYDPAKITDDFSIYVTKGSVAASATGGTPVVRLTGLAPDGGEEWFEPFNIQNFLPDMTQKEFIKAWAESYKVLFKTNETEKKISFLQFNEIVDGIPNAIDWTTKLHSDTKTQNKEFRIGDYAQRNYCKYSKDSNDKFIESGTGDGEITIDDKTLKKELTVLESPFAATAMEYNLIGLDVAHIHKLDSDDEFTVDSVPRILIDNVEATITGNDIDYENGTVGSPVSINTDVPIPYFILQNKTFNLGFNNSLLKDNYSSLTRVLNKSKKLTVLMKLSAVDFYNLDHFKPIYLAQFAAYFYINKVINWTGLGLTKVEIIRIGQRNNALIGARTRYRATYGVELYGQINRNWTTVGTATFKLTITINGILMTDYIPPLVVNAPADLVVGLGIDGGSYVTNVSDWVTSHLPEGFVMRDNGMCIDTPADTQFKFEIYYEETGPLGDYGLYEYNNDGFFDPNTGIVTDWIIESI